MCDSTRVPTPLHSSTAKRLSDNWSRLMACRTIYLTSGEYCIYQTVGK